jgi:hypothetical protein
MMRKTEHYVVVSDWACEYESGCSVLGVAHSLEKAKSIFNMYVEEEKDLALNNEWEIFENCETVFDAGEEGYYARNHTNIFIEGV